MLTKQQTKLWEAWIEALESGKYTQTKEILHKQDGTMCCLGVACNLVMEPMKKGHLTYIYNNEYFKLPNNIVEMYGFPNKCGF